MAHAPGGALTNVISHQNRQGDDLDPDVWLTNIGLGDRPTRDTGSAARIATFSTTANQTLWAPLSNMWFPTTSSTCDSHVTSTAAAICHEDDEMAT